MSYANGTVHYNLPQTVGTDKRDWFDTNQPFRDVDEALWSAKESAETAAGQVTTLNQRVSDVEDDIIDIKQDVTNIEGSISGIQATVGNLGNEIDDVKTDLMDAICASKEATATASSFHHRGSYFWYNDTLYKASDDINIGNTIVPNVNCNTVTIGTELFKGVIDVLCDATTTYRQAFYSLVQRLDPSKISGSSVLVIETQAGYMVFHMNQHLSNNGYAIYDFGGIVDLCALFSARLNKSASSYITYNRVIFSGTGSITMTDLADTIVGAGNRVLIVY